MDFDLDKVEGVEDFEEKWKQEMAKIEDNPSDEEDETFEIVDSVDTDDEVEEQATTEEEENETDEEPVEEETTSKKTKEQKKEYAFDEIRRQKAELERQAKEYEAKLKKLEQNTISLGYKNIDEFTAALEEKRIQEEAKRNNVTPEVQKRLEEFENKLKQYETKEQELVRKEKEEAVIKTIGEFALEENLDHKELERVITKATEDGVSMDDLSAMKPTALKRYLKGAGADLILEKKARQKEQKENKLKELDTGVHKNQAKVPTKKVESDFEKGMKEAEELYSNPTINYF